MEDLNAYQDDQVSAYHAFDEPFEEVLYRYRSEPTKTLRQADIPYAEIYMLYGSLLVELKRFPEAQEALKKGLRWNPMCFDIMSEYAETYKIAGDLDQFFALTLEAFKIAFHSADVARCYRNLGYYFVEKEKYSEAVGCYLMSMGFDRESPQAQSELYYISTKTDGKIKEPTLDEMKKYAKKYSFPIGPDDDVLGVALAYGKLFLQQEDPQKSRYFLNIAYDLTDDEALKEIIDSLPKEAAK